ncbi:MAG: amidohydrolase [Eubacteriales bacterium]|jgi:imidazolonepropionase-like amidohydrolase|nr:amidohydrolase [Clostridiales bacterium]
MKTTIIKNIAIYSMSPEVGNIECGYLAYSGGKITAIGPGEPDISGDCEVIDAAQLYGPDATVYPGFIDGHTHLGLCEDSLTFEGDDVNECTDPCTAQLRAIDAINPLDRCFEEARAGGITCVAAGPGSANPIGGQFAAIKTVGRRIDDMIVVAPVAMKFALGENPKNVYHGKNQTPETRMATASIIREYLQKAKKYDEAWNKYHAALDKYNIELEKARQTGDDEPDEPAEPDFDAKSEALLPVIRGELPAHFHAHRADDIFTAVRIAREFGLRFTIVHCTDGASIADILAAEGVTAFTGPNLSDRSKPELRSLSFENPGILDRAGVLVGITTDHPVIPLQYLPLCAALAVRAGMDREAALRAITLYPAKILGIDHRVGSLEPGKDADFTIWQGDPLNVMSSPAAVWIDGEKV